MDGLADAEDEGRFVPNEGFGGVAVAPVRPENPANGFVGCVVVSPYHR